MYLDNSEEFQTVWQLAHNWANSDPDTSDANSLSPAPTQAIHRLLVAITNRDISVRTENMVILDDDSLATAIIDSPHRIKINNCLKNDRFNKIYLNSLYVKRNEVVDWCTKAYLDPPSCWIPKNLTKEQVVSKADNPDDDDQDGWYEKITEPRRRKIICIGLAQQLWKAFPGLTYKEMREHPDMKRLGYSGQFALGAFKKLVRSVASEPAKLAGRPPKSKH